MTTIANVTGRKVTSPCLKCNEHVKRGCKGIICCLCDHWVHKECENMDDDTYKVIERQGTMSGIAVWICKSCSSYATKVERRLRDIDRNLVTVTSRLDSNDTDIASLKAEVTKLKDDNAKLDDRFATDKVQAKTTETVFKEINERDDRRNNAYFPECISSLFAEIRPSLMLQ